MGQINLDSKFGKLLREFSSQSNITSICDVGSWNGQGSTRCLVEGMKENSVKSTLYSIEANQEMYNKASNYWNNSTSSIKPILIHGTLHKKIMSSQDITSHVYFSRVIEHFNLYYKTDILDLEKCNVITQHLPAQLDMVVLDAGEFSSYYDWETLKSYNPKIVALDDTLVIKNHKVLNELKSLNWIVLHEGSDRHGWAILMNPDNKM